MNIGMFRTLAHRKEDAVFQQNHTMHGHSPMMHLRHSMKRVAFEVALKEKKHLAEGTMAFIFEKPNGLQMRAGQHIRMTLIDPPETDSEGESRFFSLANAPHEADLVIAMRMRDTAFKRVLGRMPIGDHMRIETLLGSPHGSFALHDDASHPAVFLVGGIGIVPAFSLIKDALERKLPHPLFLFYSNRRREDAPFLDELETLAMQHPSFTLIATLTEPAKESSSWGGETGHIDLSMIKRYVDDLMPPIYYIAGLPEMVSAMKTMLTASGVRARNIRAEEFTGFIMGQHDMTHSNTKRMGPLLPVAVVLLIIIMVSMHAFGAIILSKAISGASSLNNPILYILIGVVFAALVLFKFRHPPIQHAQKGGNPRKAAGSLFERAAAVSSPLLSFLANLHSSMLHSLMGLLMKVMLLTTGAGVMSATQDSPWIRRSMLLVALLTASFTLSRLLSRKHTRWMLLFRSISVLFTAGMITWSIATFGF